MADTITQRNATVATHSRLLAVCSLMLLLFAGNASAGLFDKLKDKLGSSNKSGADTEEVGMGLKEALTVGTENVVAQLGEPGGFSDDPLIRIPLPAQLDKVQNVLDKLGMSSLLSDLESRLNEAAEVATPKAKSLFVDAIKDMTLDDIMAIYKGPDDAATQYFRQKMSAPLAAEMKPVVDESLADVGAVQSYDNVMKQYKTLPFVSEVDTDLGSYVVEKGMDGIFFYLAKEEAAIRKNPAKRTTDLLKKVFGG